MAQHLRHVKDEYASPPRPPHPFPSLVSHDEMDVLRRSPSSHLLATNPAVVPPRRQERSRITEEEELQGGG